MTELTIKSDQINAVKSELQAALEGQQRIIQDSIKRTEINLKAFEKQYGISTTDLLKQESEGAIDDDNLEMIEWLGEVRMLQRLQSELDLIEDIHICS